MNPDPPEPNFCIPSTNTLSPILNGFTVNPNVGVEIEHVNIPLLDDSTFKTDIPLLLLTVNISVESFGSPFGSVIILTADIESPSKTTSKSPEFITSLVFGFTRTISGADAYPLEALITSIDSIVLEPETSAKVGSSALGVKVLSEE